VAAGRLAWDVKLLYDRETRGSMQFVGEGQPNLAAQVVDIPQTLPKDAQGDYLWERQGHVNQTDDDWWNISQWLADSTEFDWENDVILAWINGNPGDHTGIGGPYRAAGSNEERDATKGGVALNGLAQVTSYMAAGFRSAWARRMVLYAAHETGHALGETHTNGDPKDPANYMTVMGYGYNFLSSGLKDVRSGLYVHEEGLFTKEQRARLEGHSIFVDRPLEASPFHPGIYDGKEIRIDSMGQLLEAIVDENVAKEEKVAMINIGPMQSERS
jgi:hypothetical protein